MKKSLIAVLGLCSLLSGHAQAESYFGGNVSFLDYSVEGIDDSASVTAIVGRLGTNFNENFSGEVRVGFGVGDDSIDVFGTDVNIELDNMFGAYIRGGVPVTDSIFPYVIAGYSRGTATASVSGFGSESESESDFSFGIGADVSVSQSITINIEYMNYLDKDGAEIDGFAIGIISKF